MSESHAPPQLNIPPPYSTQEPPTMKAGSLYKHHSWSPDTCREEVWLRRKNRRRIKSVTDEDVDELRACIELGFGFDSPDDADKRLSYTLPALELFYAVNKQYNDAVSKSTASSDCDTTPSPLGSPHSFFVSGENPQTTKARLRQWAQVVACSVRQCSYP